MHPSLLIVTYFFFFFLQTCVRSFEDEEEDVDGGGGGGGVKGAGAAGGGAAPAAEDGAGSSAAVAVFKRPKIVKNPNAGALRRTPSLAHVGGALPLTSPFGPHIPPVSDTSFLPDKAREELAEVPLNTTRAHLCIC